MNAKKYDETRSDPSSHKQWHERSGMPIAVRPMSAQEINDFKVALSQSYKVPLKCIGCEISRIDDPNDPDRNDCLMIHFTVKYTDNGATRTRRINRFKVPVPDSLKSRASEVNVAPIPQEAQPAYIRADVSVLRVPPPRAGPPAAGGVQGGVGLCAALPAEHVASPGGVCAQSTADGSANTQTGASGAHSDSQRPPVSESLPATSQPPGAAKLTGVAAVPKPVIRRKSHK